MTSAGSYDTPERIASRRTIASRSAGNPAGGP
jgi:hypothetical protein